MRPLLSPSYFPFPFFFFLIFFSVFFLFPHFPFFPFFFTFIVSVSSFVSVFERNKIKNQLIQKKSMYGRMCRLSIKSPINCELFTPIISFNQRETVKNNYFLSGRLLKFISFFFLPAKKTHYV
jgi:hypothetical protein